MKATTLSALVLLVLAGALRADPPGVVERIEKAGGKVRRVGDGPGAPVLVAWMPPGATDADLAGLCELRSLGALSLAGSHVTDAGLDRVAELRGLRELNLLGCPGVTAEGAARLRKALPGCEVYR